MFQFYNANPIARAVGDCTTRALSKVLNLTWEETYIKQAIAGYKMKNMPSANEVWGAVLSASGFNRAIAPEDITVKEFCKTHPEGEYVLACSSHAIAVIDGDYFDTWDSGTETPIYYWYRKDE